MARRPSSTGHVLGDVPVWANLTSERRARVIRLLTELAHAFLTTPVKHPPKEETCAEPSQARQDSPRTP